MSRGHLCGLPLLAAAAYALAPGSAAAQVMIGFGNPAGPAGPAVRRQPTEEVIGLRLGASSMGSDVVGFEYGSMRGKYVLSPIRLTAALGTPRTLTGSFGIRFLIPISQKWGGELVAVPDLFGGVAFADNVRTNPGFISHVGLGGAWRGPNWLLGIGLEHALFATNPVTGLGRTLPDGDWSFIASASYRLLPEKEPVP